jgi:tRNA(adenine34) deaminase
MAARTETQFVLKTLMHRLYLCNGDSYMWDDIEQGFQLAFNEAWEAYQKNTIPIGVVILNNDGKIMATGRNQVSADGDGLIRYHQIAHAEINAILKLSEINDEIIHKSIRTYTLYSTMEPCPLCFGAIVMGSIRNVKYAARDSWAGAAALNNSIDYIKNKNIMVSGPFIELEIVQIAMQTCYELQTRNPRTVDMLLSNWKNICKTGVNIGEYLYKNNILKEKIHKSFNEVYNLIISYL